MAVDRFADALPPDAGERVLVVRGGEERTDSVDGRHHGPDRRGRGGRDAGPRPRRGAPGGVARAHGAGRRPAGRAGTGAVVPLVPGRRLAEDDDARASGDRRRSTATRSLAAQTPQAATPGPAARRDRGDARLGTPATDEAGGLAAGGIGVRAVEGDPVNRKLTEPGDVAMRAPLSARWSGPARPRPRRGRACPPGSGSTRIALEEGRDAPGRAAFPDEPRGPAGHSDGDAALHALIDALLGAARLGDVGTLVPAGRREVGGTPTRRSSCWRRGRTTARGRLAAGRRRPGHRGAAAGDRSRAATRSSKRLAELLGLEPEAVCVKGTTSDGLGFAGSEGIAAFAVATVEPA